MASSSALPKPSLTTLLVYACGTCQPVNHLQSVIDQPSMFSPFGRWHEDWMGLPHSGSTGDSISSGARNRNILVARVAPIWEPPPPYFAVLDGDSVRCCVYPRSGNCTHELSSATQWPTVLRAAIDSRQNTLVSIAVCAANCLWFDQDKIFRGSKNWIPMFREILLLDIASVACSNVHSFTESLTRCFPGLQALSMRSLRFLEGMGDNTQRRRNATDETQRSSCYLKRLEMSNQGTLARDVQHCARALQHLLPSTQRTLEHLTLDSTTMAALHVIQDRGAARTRTIARPKDPRPTPPAQPPPIFDLISLSTLDIEVRIAARPDAAANKELADTSRMLVSLLRSPPKGVVVDIKIYPEDPGESGISLWPTRLCDGFAALKRAFDELGDTVLHPMRIRIVQGQPGGGEAVEEMRVIFPDEDVRTETLAQKR